MEGYPRAAVERMMKVQEVMLQAAAKISWLQAAHIIGVTDRTMRRWRERNYQMGRQGLVDRRRVRPSPRRVALGGGGDGDGLSPGRLPRIYPAPFSLEPL